MIGCPSKASTEIVTGIALALLLAAAAPLAAQDGVAVYDVTFTGTWSAQTHPLQFPPGPHFSALIGGTHDSRVAFWAPGALASPGIEAMAELGDPFPLAAEVLKAKNAGTADQVLLGPGIVPAPGVASLRVTVSAAYSEITLVSMLAPSPDWFVGVAGLDLRPGGEWLNDTTITLSLWDAGTDSGTTYLAPDAEAVPHLPIAPIDTTQGSFAGQSPIVGSMRFRRVASSSVYGCGVNPAGSMTVDGTPPLLGNTVTLHLDDPTHSVGAAALTQLAFAASAAPPFPCGILVPGLGFGSGTGELLLAPPFPLVAGPPWSGNPVAVPLPVPTSAGLIGQRVYVQGVLVGASGFGVTDAAELALGQ